MTPTDFFATVQDPTTWSRSTVDRLLELKSDTKLSATVLDADPELAAVTIYPGNLHVKADFSFNRHVLVLGDLTVDGIINGDPAHAILMVAGNMSCKRLALVRVYMFVTGDVDVRDTVYATTYGNAIVAGRIKTRLYAHSDWQNLDLDGQPTDANIDATLRVDLDAREAKGILRRAVKADVLPKKSNAGVSDIMEAIIKSDDAFVGPS